MLLKWVYTVSSIECSSTSHPLYHQLSMIIRSLFVLFFTFLSSDVTQHVSLNWCFLSRWHAWTVIIYYWLIHTFMIRHGSLHKTSKSEVDDW